MSESESPKLQLSSNAKSPARSAPHAALDNGERVSRSHCEAATKSSPQQVSERRWRSEKEAVAYSGLSRTYIRARIKDGEIVARKAGRRKLIDWPQFLTWLESLPLASVRRPNQDQPDGRDPEIKP